MQSFNARTELIDLPALQGCILLSFVALAEGDSAQEALLSSQAICMVRMLRLPESLSPDPIQREVEIRSEYKRPSGYTCQSNSYIQSSGLCG